MSTWGWLAIRADGSVAPRVRPTPAPVQHYRLERAAKKRAGKGGTTRSVRLYSTIGAAVRCGIDADQFRRRAKRIGLSPEEWKGSNWWTIEQIDRVRATLDTLEGVATRAVLLAGGE